MDRPVSVLAVATAVPPHVIEQAEIARMAPAAFEAIFERHPGIGEVFAHAGIERRHIARPIQWYVEPRGWTDRTEAYLEVAGALFLAAAREALTRAGLTPGAVDVVVLVSSTGVSTPSLDARVGVALGLRPDVMRVPVFGLGCAGGVTGLAIASRLARAEPGKVVLLVAVELCSLAVRFDRPDKIDVVAAALFADGAAAAVLQADGDTLGIARLGLAAEHTWPDTLDVMGWTVDPVGLGVVLTPALPRFLEEHLAAPARAFVARLGLDGHPPQFVCHLGSAKVLSSIETALGLSFGTLATERAVLRQNGNMSSPSVLFVLEAVLARGMRGPAVLAALGPGFTASFVEAELGHA